MLTKERGVAEDAPKQPETIDVSVTVTLTVKPNDDFDVSKVHDFVKEAVNEQMLYGAPDGADILEVEFQTNGRA